MDDKFPIENENVNSAKFSLLMEIYANVLTTRDYMLAYIAQKQDIDPQQMIDGYAKALAENKDKIFDNIYKEYGHIDLNDIAPEK